MQVKMEKGGFRVILLKRAEEAKPVNQVVLTLDTTDEKLQLKLNIAENKVQLCMHRKQSKIKYVEMFKIMK